MRNVANTTVISNFAAVNRLDLLQRIVKELHIPLEVYKEIKNGQASAPHSPLAACYGLSPSMVSSSSRNVANGTSSSRLRPAR